MNSARFREGALAGVAGLLLYAATAGLEILLGTGPMASAVLEETAKAGVLLGFGVASRGAAGAGGPARQVRSRALARARGLSLGLVAIVVFAAAENLAYLVAFPESGILGRLLWSLPVHLVAALLEALGCGLLLRRMEEPADLRRKLAGATLALGGLALGAAWHGLANLAVSSGAGRSVLAGGAAAMLLLFPILLSQFLRHVHLGGFLNDPDSR